MIAVGFVLSIRLTVAIVVHVFPARSQKVNLNIQLPIKRYQVAFIPVSGSKYPVSIASTFPLVNVPDVGAYITVAVGGVLSIRVTVAMIVPVFPARSEKLNVNTPLPVKRCQVAFIPVSGSEYPVSVASTF